MKIKLSVVEKDRYCNSDFYYLHDLTIYVWYVIIESCILGHMAFFKQYIMVQNDQTSTERMHYIVNKREKRLID